MPKDINVKTSVKALGILFHNKPQSLLLFEYLGHWPAEERSPNFDSVFLSFWFVGSMLITVHSNLSSPQQIFFKRQHLKLLV